VSGVRTPAFALVAAMVAAGCGRGGSTPGAPDAADAANTARTLRLRMLIDTLPRIEAEERAWPRGPSLACDERSAGRVREIEALRAEIEALSAGMPARGELATVLSACEELKGCTRCDEGYAGHCERTRELLVEMVPALARAGLR
jgi:hypothetical protein